MQFKIRMPDPSERVHGGHEGGSWHRVAIDDWRPCCCLFFPVESLTPISNVGQVRIPDDGF